MTCEDLRAWRKWMRWSQRNAAEALGISRASFQFYEAGKLPVSRPVELACYALARGIRSYNGREPSTPVE
jgi:DNA-binding XRE family transcriptional regulator